MLDGVKTTNLVNDSRVLLVMAGLGLAGMNCAAAGFGAADLRCEYGRNPTAIGETQPRLSWVVEGAPQQRGVMQGAYRVLVASSPELLDQDQGDLWDSGKVSSARSVNVVYGG